MGLIYLYVDIDAEINTGIEMGIEIWIDIKKTERMR
jgi:hypothetical protein